MTNDTHYRSRIQMPLAVLPLLALLLAFLSSITHQHAAATSLNHGFIGTLDHLVVASHNESGRAQSGYVGKDSAADGDRDAPQWWSAGSMDSWAGQRVIASVSYVDAGDLPSAARYVIPLLRAPPLA